jgi:hypothetical protein
LSAVADGTRRQFNLLAVFAVIYRKLSAAAPLSPQKAWLCDKAANKKQRKNSGRYDFERP